MRGLDSTLKSAGAGCQMGKGVVEQRGRRSGRDAIPPTGGGCFVGIGFRACLFGGGFGSLDKSLRFVPYWVVPT